MEILMMLEMERDELLEMPMILTNAFHYFITLVSVTFAGHLGQLELAGATIGSSSLEYWAFELLVLIAGMMPNAELTTSVTAICVNTEEIAYMGTSDLSAAASTRVSDELGAGNPDKAKHAKATTLKLSVLLALLIVLPLVIGHDIWCNKRLWLAESGCNCKCSNILLHWDADCGRPRIQD
ncbi:unnamed protein product [Dovyalis caffra]|uniref:Uncharacterized protein n=1 Tax=Dovyalis caffra TaxID=77055 RepID=A0AAV1R423_9ROSI|nr:unnamed protein product [Dovyalis caffra]